jgi:hypothetical protein
MQYLFQITLAVILLAVVLGILRILLNPKPGARTAENKARTVPEVELERIRAKDRAEARALYERLMMEKLGVVKRAIDVGFSHDELADLDARLERLIGREQLARLLDDEPGTVEAADWPLDEVSELEGNAPPGHIDRENED